MRQAHLTWLFVLAAGCNDRAAISNDSGLADLFVGDLATRPRDAPPVDRTPADAAASWDRVPQACAIAASCGVNQVPPLTASACIDWFGNYPWRLGGYGQGGEKETLDRLVRCAQGADCQAFFDCFGGNWIGPSPCREGGTCDRSGKMMVGWEEKKQYLDCDALGLTCVELFTGAIRSCCARQVCASASPWPVCSGEQGSYCAAGALIDFDCSASGRRCTPESTEYEPSGLCQGKGGACNVSDPVQCNGTVASYCSANRIATFNCSTNPFRSACATAGHTPCVLAGSECNESFVGECSDGYELTVCVNGHKQKIDCRSLGFHLCVDLGVDVPYCAFYE